MPNRLSFTLSNLSKHRQIREDIPEYCLRRKSENLPVKQQPCGPSLLYASVAGRTAGASFQVTMCFLPPSSSTSEKLTGLTPVLPHLSHTGNAHIPTLTLLSSGAWNGFPLSARMHHLSLDVILVRSPPTLFLSLYLGLPLSLCHMRAPLFPQKKKRPHPLCEGSQNTFPQWF